ncbi:DUF983 domain-containing protein [Agrobacterium vitis]|uniref:DUF983 domain-containing protein n=1 Tax=Agrobacterium vitis TaxID=373 RepID=UPI0012E82DFD|nr:DUF983 domain-containing protein [Agrobacterium vitis]MVA26398.1 DUF983 domain-containing protein [Agrobacterium vitis]
MSVSQSPPVTRFGGGKDAARPLGRSILRGLMCTCPACGSGRLFKAFLKPVDTCAACGEDLSHQRADDLPPYIVIMIVGHVLLGGYMMTDLVFVLSTWAHLAIWTPIAVIVSLLIIQPIKGGVVGLQWALRMHGFGEEPEVIEDYDERYPPK